MSFVPLHCHSFFSFYAGVCNVKTIVSRAKALGMKALALTDTDRMSGLIQFYLECKKENIKPVLGAELTEPHRPNENIVLLAKNREGYADICEILTKRHIESDRFSFLDIFSKFYPNIMLITAFPDILDLLSHTENRRNLYGELVNNSSITRERSRCLEQKAKALNIPLIVSNNSFFLDPQDWETHRILCAVGLNSTLSRLKPEEYASQRAYLKSGEDMEQLFPGHIHAVHTTGIVADQCNVELDLGRWILPKIVVPSGYTPKIYLKKLAFEGLEANYGKSADYEEARRIQEMELEIIAKSGYQSYFLMVKEIREWANNRFRTGYRGPKDCTLLRGSAANSITFYNIGVSDLDPVRYGLYFQRFLNEERASPPDADLDFGWDERDQVFDYIAARWGSDRVAITCTTNHFRRHAAFRETAKVFGYSEEQITEILKSLKRGIKRIDDSEIRHIERLARKIVGKPRFLGQHPGGVLITNDSIRRHVACEFSGGCKSRVITQVDMHSGIDELGLIKFDFLGNGSISVLRDTLQQLKDQGFPDPKVRDLEKCYGDSKVRNIIREGKTKGIFYIESPAQARLNRQVQADTFEEIVLTSSLVRPAGAHYARVFVERHRKMKKGIKDWNFLHPSLEPILNESHDVCAFQEHVTKICCQVAGFTYKKADMIRKMMNSLHEGILSSEEYYRISGEFINGCIKNKGFNLNQAMELWRRVSSFTGFSFCKSHSASYAQLSFKCAYLKAHYPAQFLASVLSNGHGFYTKDVYLDEARISGVRILPVNINESGIKYRGKHNWIRPGFMDIRDLSRKSLENIIAERERNGRFRNIIEFVKRVNIYKKEIEHLVLAGAFDGFGLSQPESLYLLDGIYGSIRSEEPDLFEDRNLYSSDILHPGLTDYSFAEKCLNELYLFGFMLSGNILDILDLHPASKNAVPANKLKRYVKRRVKVFGRPITERTHIVRKSGRPMKFVTIEDKTGYIDIIFWPEFYDRFADVIADSGPFEIWGTVTEDRGAYTLNADFIRSVTWTPNLVDFELASIRLRNSSKKDSLYAGNKQAIAAA